jgi:hypothetical protein
MFVGYMDWFDEVLLHVVVGAGLSVQSQVGLSTMVA